MSTFQGFTSLLLWPEEHLYGRKEKGVKGMLLKKAEASLLKIS